MEPFRPTFHFTPAKNWTNDPNGLVYADGVYHLFFQHNPFANEWGNMSWGHATSGDLVEWTELPVAIPCTDDEAIFSGSVVVDHDNSSGFGDGSAPPLVAIYTSTFSSGLQAQSLAYSTDGGTEWTKFEGNPVLDRQSNNFRDPHVFWFDGGDGSESYWVMVAVEAVDYMTVFYRSDDLRNWTYLSSFGPAGAVGGMWECPDLFPLPLDGDPDTIKWVLIVNINPGGVAGGSAGQYFVGHFDGVAFTPEGTVPPSDAPLERFSWLDYGRDFYAAITFTNAPDGRRILLGWMDDWEYADSMPTEPWRGAMSLPRELGLVGTDDGPRLTSAPVREIRGRLDHDSAIAIGQRALDVTAVEMEVPSDVAAYVLNATIASPAAAVEILLSNAGGDVVAIRFDGSERTLELDRTRSGNTGFSEAFPSVERASVPGSGPLDIEVFVDTASIEIFAANGLVAITDVVLPSSLLTRVALASESGSCEIDEFVITPIVV